MKIRQHHVHVAKRVWRADKNFRRAVPRGSLSGHNLLPVYCQLLYERHSTYEEVARRTKLDRRTVKAYLEKHAPTAPSG